jgi:hypothetical protein
MANEETKPEEVKAPPFREEAKIRVLAKTNPRKEGSKAGGTPKDEGGPSQARHTGLCQSAIGPLAVPVRSVTLGCHTGEG